MKDRTWVLSGIMMLVIALVLLATSSCVGDDEQQADAGPSVYLRCLSLCQELKTDGLLCGERPRYPESECASTCDEALR